MGRPGTSLTQFFTFQCVCFAFSPLPKVEVMWPHCTWGFLIFLLSPGCAAPSWVSKFFKISPQYSFVTRDVDVWIVNTKTVGPFWITMHGGPQEWQENPSGRKPHCIPWQALDTHEEVPLPAVYSSRFSLSPGSWLECWWPCLFSDLWFGEGSGVSLWKELGL